MPAAMITGASTGIGYACADALVNQGWRVFAGVRKGEDGERLVAALGDRVRPVLADVTDEAALSEAARIADAALGGERLAGLVCNAGIALPGPLLHQPLEQFQRQLEVNAAGVVRTVRAFAPLLGTASDRAGRPGRIVMMSSVQGRRASPFSGGYAASKHALEGLSVSLRREMMLYDIPVTIIAPGPVATPIWDKTDEIDAEALAETDYAPALRAARTYMLGAADRALPASKVAEKVVAALTARRPKLRVEIEPFSIQSLLMRMLPDRVVDAAMARALGLRPPRP